MDAQLGRVGDRLLFGVGQLLDLLGELVLGQRLGPDALNEVRQCVEVDPELAQRPGDCRIGLAGEDEQEISCVGLALELVADLGRQTIQCPSEPVEPRLIDWLRTGPLADRGRLSLVACLWV